jgi:hypothetical protein
VRRTFVTGCNNLGVAPYIVETIVNHTKHKSGVAGVYNLAVYTDQVRDALEQWSQKVGRLLTTQADISR